MATLKAKRFRIAVEGAITDGRVISHDWISWLAELNNVETGDMNKKFTVEPTVTQTLMNRM